MDGTRIQVVGIVEDGKYKTITEAPEPAIYAYPEAPSSSTWLVVRSNWDPQAQAAAMRLALHNLDAAVPITIRTWNKQLDSALFASRVATVSLGVLGGLGAMLAVTGIFGMASYSVSKRLRELGIRIALGAQRKEVLSAALGRAFRLLALLVGRLVLGIAATRVLAYIVYQATPRDPFVLGGVVLTMLLLGLIATWIPAYRALKADPLLLRAKSEPQKRGPELLQYASRDERERRELAVGFPRLCHPLPAFVRQDWLRRWCAHDPAPVSAARQLTCGAKSAGSIRSAIGRRY